MSAVPWSNATMSESRSAKKAQSRSSISTPYHDTGVSIAGDVEPAAITTPVFRMPHAIDKPSSLADETGHMFTSSRSDSDVPSYLAQAHEKVNGNTASSTHISMKAEPDDGSDGYLNRVESRSTVKAETFLDGSLSAVPNGRSSVGSWDHKSSLEGSNRSINGALNRIHESGRKVSLQQNGSPRTSHGDEAPVASTNGMNPNTVTPPDPSTTTTDSELPKKSLIPAPISTQPQSTGPLTYTTSILPPTPQPEISPSHTTSSPHRFSSPPTYTAAPVTTSPLATSPSTHSLQHPGALQLKHRHTLQVPKLGPGRSSRDGDDALYSTGRFSPTTISGARRGSLSLVRRNTQSIHSNMPHEEIPPDEDAILWAEAIRQKRASKRRRKEEEDDDRVVVGTRIDQNHVNWVTAYNMLTGIRFTVSRTNAKLDRELNLDDFTYKNKFSFDITGNELTPSAKYDFKFKDYAPWVFRKLRAKFRIDPADYLMSLTSKYILSELGSPGKSGSFFYFSRDYKYIIKTIHHAEHKFLRKILREYYMHVEQNPNTLLSQFYGLHRVKMPYGRKIHFVVMNNLFPPHRDIHQTFDLKGSTIGRDFREEDLEKNPRATLKDLNWLRRDLHLEFGPEKKRAFFEQMERDVRLLQRLDIMDYSMLVGIHNLQIGNQENLRDKTLKVFQPGGEGPPGADAEDRGPDGRGNLLRTPSKLENARKARELRQIIKQEKPVPMGQSSSRMPDTLEENMTKKDFLFYGDDGGFRATHEDNSPGEEIFFLSIIDCLTHYGTVKKLEHLWKGLSHDKRLISPISPHPYGDRFIDFIEGITKSSEEAAREAKPLPASDNNSISLDVTRRRSNSQHMHRTNTTNTTIQRNEDDAIRTERHGENEVDRPDSRTITTVRSPSAERSNGLQGQTLPVVEEIGEASSTGGRSEERRPTTPAKDDQRPPTPAKDFSPARNANGNASIRTGKTISRSSLDKDLPPLPGI